MNSAEYLEAYAKLYPETVKGPVQEQKDMCRDVASFNATLEKKMGEI